jgi:hypothetical protein
MRSVAHSLLILALLAATPAFAQQEPPARVGRVAFVAGQLGFHERGETAWSKASLNYPVAAGGAFWTDPKSRAELRIGSRSIAMSGNTELDIAKLDQQVMQLAVPQGRINVRVRTLLEGESIEIDLPRGAVWILQPGIYDIDAGGGDQPERIAVFEGSARFVGGTLDVAINAGDAAVISGTQTLAAAIEKATPDEFAKWCRTRDYDQRRLAAPYHVSPQMTGYEVLDEYGSWRTAGNYGTVWYPRSVPVGWTPYRDGYWSWVEPWGWNWIDSEPWGFAPFHYGRWASIDGLWAWAPGDFVDAPVYAPALVSFLSDPAAIVTSALAGAAVGWFPLGPGEAYSPWYSNDPSYIRAVNAGVVADPRSLAAGSAGGPAAGNQNFANRRAATVVPQQAFAAAQPVGRSALPISDRAAQQARVTAQAPARPPGAAGGSARGGHGAAGAGTVAAGAAAAAAGGRGGAHTAGMASGAAHVAAPHGGAAARMAQPRAGRLAGAPRMVRMAAPHAATPRMARAAAPHMAAPRVAHTAAPRMAAPRMAAPRGGPVAHLGGGGPRGGGPAFHLGGGGGAPHGGGGGGGAPHGGGGGGAPHGGGGGGGGKGHH